MSVFPGEDILHDNVIGQTRQGVNTKIWLSLTVLETIDYPPKSLQAKTNWLQLREVDIFKSCQTNENESGSLLLPRGVVNEPIQDQIRNGEQRRKETLTNCNSRLWPMYLFSIIPRYPLKLYHDATSGLPFFPVWYQPARFFPSGSPVSV